MVQQEQQIELNIGSSPALLTLLCGDRDWWSTWWWLSSGYDYNAFSSREQKIARGKHSATCLNQIRAEASSKYYCSLKYWATEPGKSQITPSQNAMWRWRTLHFGADWWDDKLKKTWVPWLPIVTKINCDMCKGQMQELYRFHVNDRYICNFTRWSMQCLILQNHIYSRNNVSSPAN